MTIRRYVDRSRIETTQACRRRRWYEYEEGGVGIVSAKLALPLAVGGAVHEGLAVLLSEGQAAVDKYGSVAAVPANVWMEIEEHAVAKALEDFAAYAGRLEVEERLLTDGGTSAKT